MEYSPTFADKKALDTRQMDLEEIAEAIVEMLPDTNDADGELRRIPLPCTWLNGLLSRARRGEALRTELSICTCKGSRYLPLSASGV